MHAHWVIRKAFFFSYSFFIGIALVESRATGCVITSLFSRFNFGTSFQWLDLVTLPVVETDYFSCQKEFGDYFLASQSNLKELRECIVPLFVDHFQLFAWIQIKRTVTMLKQGRCIISFFSPSDQVVYCSCFVRDFFWKLHADYVKWCMTPSSMHLIITFIKLWTTNSIYFWKLRCWCLVRKCGNYISTSFFLYSDGMDCYREKIYRLCERVTTIGKYWPHIQEPSLHHDLDRIRIFFLHQFVLWRQFDVFVRVQWGIYLSILFPPQ